MSNVVAIIGSPRKRGNTDRLADAFIRGAIQSGNTVTRFHLADYKVNGCLGCDYCTRNHGKCIQEDAMQPIYAALYQADTVVLATPLYYFGISSQLKAVIDRFYASIAAPFKVSAGILLLTYGRDNKHEADMAIAHYRAIMRGMGWRNKGVAIADHVFQVGDIAGHSALLQAENLGRSV